MSSSCASAGVKPRRLAGAAATLLWLSACEAPLDLEAVERQLAEPVRRSDQFQAATVDADTVIVVGNQGLVLVSHDSGASWQRSELPGWPALIAVTRCPDGRFAALAAEGRVWLSADRGATWSDHALESEEAVQDITCDPSDRLWVVGSFSSIFSSDDGSAWDLWSLDEDLILTNVQFVDADTGFVTGEFGTVLKTTDGGADWERLDELRDSFYPQDMYFADSERGWLVGLQGQVLHTADGGLSWELQDTGTRAPLYGIAPLGDALYAVGGEGTVQRRLNGHWGTVDHGQPILLFLRAVHPVSGDRLLVGGQAGALHLLEVGGMDVNDTAEVRDMASGAARAGR